MTSVNKRQSFLKDKKKVLHLILWIGGILLFLLLLWFLLIRGYVLFHQNEQKLLEAAKKYYEINERRLPKEKEIKTLSLQTLYDEKYLGALYIPNSKKLCDTDRSWVKVKREENGTFKYYVYLKCGSKQSSVDHTGPVITLKGKESILVDKNSTYVDEGIKEVSDQKDGKLDIADVSINNKVDTSKIGTYEVTYTAYDHLRNKTVKKRTVKVVEMLNTVVKQNTNQTGIYQGVVDNNYLLFSGMLFRIMRVESDGAIKIVADQPVSNMNYHSSDASFEKSNIKEWLNEYYYQHIAENSKKYLIDRTWCNENVAESLLNTTTCTKETAKLPVGLVSIQELNESLVEEQSYLNSKTFSWMINRQDNNTAWFNGDTLYASTNKHYYADSGDRLNGVRPVLVLKKDTYAIAGDGTATNPYKLEDYGYAEAQTKVNKRLSGEVLSYSGYLWRIMDVEKDGTTKIIMDSSLSVNGSEVTTGYDTAGESKVYDPTEKGNIGYFIETKGKTYVNTSLFVKKEIRVPIYEKNAIYQKEVKSKTYKVTLASPNMYELFATKSLTNDYSSYWYLNSSNQKDTKYVMASMGNVYYRSLNDATTAGVKLVAYLNKDVKITSGKGTMMNPYYISKG